MLNFGSAQQPAAAAATAAAPGAQPAVAAQPAATAAAGENLFFLRNDLHIS
jgi:hypothetical protein